MASPGTERKLPSLPAEIWHKIIAEVSKFHDYGEFIHLWTQYRHVSSVFMSETEKALIDQHLKKPTMYVDLFAVLSALFNQELVKSGKMSEEKMLEPDIYGVIELAHSSVIWLPLTFYQLSTTNNKDITFRYEGGDVSPTSDQWPKFSHLSGKVMLQPLEMGLQTTPHHLPVQVEWVNRNEQVALSLTFDWKQLFSMFLIRFHHTYKSYFRYGDFRFARPCPWPLGDDRTLRLCKVHEPVRRLFLPLCISFIRNSVAD